MYTFYVFKLIIYLKSFVYIYYFSINLDMRFCITDTGIRNTLLSSYLMFFIFKTMIFMSIKVNNYLNLFKT